MVQESQNIPSSSHEPISNVYTNLDFLSPSHAEETFFLETEQDRAPSFNRTETETETETEQGETSHARVKKISHILTKSTQINAIRRSTRLAKIPPKNYALLGDVGISSKDNRKDTSSSSSSSENRQEVSETDSQDTSENISRKTNDKSPSPEQEILSQNSIKLSKFQLNETDKSKQNYNPILPQGFKCMQDWYDLIGLIGGGKDTLSKALLYHTVDGTAKEIENTRALSLKSTIKAYVAYCLQQENIYTLEAREDKTILKAMAFNDEFINNLQEMKNLIAAKQELAHTGFKIVIRKRKYNIHSKKTGTYNQYNLEYVKDLQEKIPLFTSNRNGFYFIDKKYNKQLEMLKEENPLNLFEAIELLPS